LASRTEVEQSFYEQTTFSDINYVGTVNIIESIIRNCTDFKLFIQASTMETYGWQPVSTIVANEEPLYYPQYWAFDEKTPLKPNAPYAVAKAAVEQYLEYVQRSQGFPYISIRTTNCYGRSNNNFFVTESIISQMINSDIIYLGYKNPYRNFIYIDDLINLYTTIIDAGSEAAIGPITIGPNNPIQISKYVELIADQLPWSGHVIWDTRPKRPGEIYYLSSVHDKVTQLLGWKPTTELVEGINKTIYKWK
jgi:nucleoside-diphosphate-sugar epimerase